jgi:mannose-6-phosphate isomerase class I
VHVPQSLASIDFNDFEPSLLPSAFVRQDAQRVRPLVSDPLFSVEVHQADPAVTAPLRPNKMQIVALLAGRVHVISGQENLILTPGQFCLVPASLVQVILRSETPATFLRIEA